MRRLALLLPFVAFCAPSSAQEPTPNNAGFGGIYADFALDPQTGSALHLGVAVDRTSGRYFVSATGPGGLPPHRVHEFNAAGVLLGSFAQPTAHNGSAFGIRDLEFDGQSLLGGSEAGISVFAPNGALMGSILTANGPRPITQPIRGAAGGQLAVFRAVALDAQGNGGNGSLLVADFASPILEIDFAGNVLATYANQGWSAYGLTIDPVTRNPWVFAGPGGAIEELDRATMTPTGRRLQPASPGAPGGLALASPVAGHHEPWPNEAAFVHLVQGAEDRIAVQRVHLFPSVRGWDEPVLEVATSGGPWVRGVSTFWRGDSLDLRTVDPSGVLTGAPAWFVLNVYLDADRDAYTNLGAVVPGAGLLIEHRALNPFSTPSTVTFLYAGTAIGQTLSLPFPPSLPLADGDLFRAQVAYVQPASPQVLASTNEANWRAFGGERGIVVAAEGPTSFHGALGQPFWSVRSDATHAHGAITAVEFSLIGATGTAAIQRFDIDQIGMDDRFDGGNSTLPGCSGTYRNGSAAACGLDFAAPGVFIDPACHGPGESAGVRFSTPPDPLGNVLDLHFAFTAFVPGRTFEFDCDTDGGAPAGADHAGMIVRVTTANSGVLRGVLQVDANAPNRAVVWFP
jgi:hypothetical protein